MDTPGTARLSAGYYGKDVYESDGDFECIYRLYFKRVYDYFYCRTGSVQNAEDLTADLFERALRKLGRYDPAKAPINVWLFGLARNISINFYHTEKKRLSRMVAIEQAEAVAGGASPEETAAQGELTRELTAVILSLPQKERKIVAMRYAAGLKNTEIAAVTGMTATNVGVVLHRALQKKKKRLQKMGVDVNG